MTEVVKFPAKSVQPQIEDDLRASVEQLADVVAKMDEGMKLMIGVITEYEKRIRRLELDDRRQARKTAIYNARGERAN